MVQGVENWAHITGIVEEIRDADLDGFLLARMRVNDVGSVSAYPNFFEDAKGTLVDVHLPRNVAEGDAVKPGARVSCRVRKAGITRIFADAEDFEVTS